MASHRLTSLLPQVLLAFFVGTGAVRGQVSPTPAPEDPEIANMDMRVKQFLDKVASDQAQQAFKDLFAGTRFESDKQSESLVNLISKAAALENSYGECLDMERIAAKKVGSRVIVVRYLYQCERFPVVWHFVFYRSPPRRDEVVPPPSSWQLISVRFDTELERLID